MIRKQTLRMPGMGRGGFEFDECFFERKCDEALRRLKHNRNKYVKSFAREAFMTPNLFPERACEGFSQRTSILEQKIEVSLEASLGSFTCRK